MELNWLHISDIHFHYASYESERIREEFIKKLTEVSKNKKIDCVFCTGDLADKNGDYNQNLEKYISDISDALKIVRKNVYIVPGNHDHDRNCAKTILDNIYEYYTKESDKTHNETEVNFKIDNLCQEDISEINNAFSKYSDFCNSFYGEPETSVFHKVIYDSNEDFSITCINTAIFDIDSNYSSSKLHIGVKKLHDEIKKAKIDKNKINIAIGHHPTSYMAPEERDRFLDCLNSNGINIYLCGHSHKAGFEYHYKYDITEVISSYGNSDSYDSGGFSIGHTDTTNNQFYVDYYRWKKGNSWVRDTQVDLCDETGRCYINGKKYNHISVHEVVVPIKLYGSSINKRDIDLALSRKYEILPYLSSELDVNSLDWEKEFESINDFAKSLKEIKDKHINIFALAPIPLIVNLGYQLQNSSDMSLFQYDRVSSRWVNASDKECPQYDIHWGKRSRIFKKHELAIVVSTSTTVRKKQIINRNKCDMVNLFLIEPGLGEPLYENHYKKMLNDLFSDIDNCVNLYKKVHIFASVPAGMAIEIGRHLQKGVYPPISLYNYNKTYKYVCTIND